MRNVDRGLQDPQQWNRYAYANNNPLRFVDPDGRTFWDVLDFVSAGASVVEFVKNPSWKGAGMALLDVAGAALPIIPSPGTVRRMVQAADAVVGGARAVARRADDAASTAKKALHGNKVDDRPATLYEKYDKDGNFQKHGVTKHEDPSKRYTKNEIDGGTVVRVDRGPRTEMIRKERERVKTNPGPQNREPWAGSGVK